MLAKDKNRELIKNFEKVYVVGNDLKHTDLDENCASFCIDKNWTIFNQQIIFDSKSLALWNLKKNDY